ncbi:inosose isomerase [Gracilibacillus boraciitolerans JCM 21714]|uniref:Inosose isomerase n=1 Tax=Gracilibacillus boraciitolerans JCM 21714 TaxID=1298598 RepID=W4VPD9_9BACI|nr:sugar phosphate isomerase/epimerase [Gracilibacillus boraciitolerans]GAE95026.1 inosose isomerase [Gracilibacillus boraciitolerans JCM 21714]
MKIGVFTVLYQDLPFQQMLDKLQGLGVKAVELGTGNYPGDQHCNPDYLLDNRHEIKKFKDAIKKRNMIISGLSCQGNPLHPNKEIAKKHHKTWEKTIQLAEQLEVDVVNCFSGCPGDSFDAQFPNWVTCAWPPEYEKLRKWQWDEVVIPYWQRQSQFASKYGINKIAIEMHPGFVVYNPETLVELRERAGNNIGANFDPSHLIWQGIDPVEAIKYLGKKECIYHFHAKDTYVNEANKSINGVLDTKHYSEFLKRAWSFRTIGYGQSQKTWKDILSALRAVGFDNVISIEHEDMLASVDEGLKQAIQLLEGSMLKESPTEIWWA